MKINICNIGEDAASYRNLFMLTHYSLQELGHTVVVTQNQLLDGCFHLFMFGAVPDQAIIDQIQRAGIEYGYISTELFMGNGWQFAPFNDDQLSRFSQFIAGCKLVTSYFIDECQHLLALNPNSYHTPFGFSQKMATIDLADEKMFDIYFFGSANANPYRQKILGGLASSGLNVVHHENGTSDIMRNTFVSAARVNINLAQTNDYQRVSYRVPWLANNRVCAILNTSDDPEGYSAFGLSAGDEDLAATCLEFIGRRWFRSRGEESFEKFRNFPMSKYFEQAFDQAFGG